MKQMHFQGLGQVPMTERPGKAIGEHGGNLGEPSQKSTPSVRGFWQPT